jgi:hypothetical protein
MRSDNRVSDPWKHAINMLKETSESWSLTGFQSSRLLANQRVVLGTPSRRRLNTVVKVLDKPTSTTATVAWWDSTSCHYGDQMWSMRTARVDGVCALTGAPVRKGDAVYQPRAYGFRPCNAEEMILSSALGVSDHDQVKPKELLPI